MNDGWNEHHYAVVVGIDRYPGLSDLRHAKRDAEHMVTWLRSREGGNLPEDNVFEVMADPAVEPGFTVETAVPTETHVDDKLGTVNKRMREKLDADPAAWESSRLYIYASAHGVAPGAGVAAVLMANVDSDPHIMSFGRNIELSLYETWYRACGVFREVVLLADCCRDREFTASGNGPPWLSCAEPYAPSNTALGLATTYGTLAFEPEEDDDGHGYFTRAMVDGLTGGAADPMTGEVTTTSLGEYIRRAVPVLTDGKRYRQQPSMLSDAANPIALRAGRGPLEPPRRTTTIHFPRGFAGEVELLAGRSATGDRWRAEGGPWTIELDEGIYRVRPSDGSSTPFAEDGIFDVIAKDRIVRL